MQTKNKSASNESNPVDPQIIINAAIDCAALYTSGGGMWQEQGIFMFDNNVAGGSTGEGGLELVTTVGPMQYVGFNVYDIDGGYGNATVNITAIEYSSGVNIFTDNGWPTVQTSSQSTCQWMGQVMQQGNMIYQIKISIQYPDQPVLYFWWDPYMNCTND